VALRGTLDPSESLELMTQMELSSKHYQGR
jgi:hypothetical protein